MAIILSIIYYKDYFMKKIILLFLPIVLLSSSLFAQERLYSFIGVQTSTSKFDKITAPTIGVKYGKQSKDIRTAISYNYGKNSDDTFQTLIMQIDTGILTNTFKKSPLKPYIGASLGLIQHKNNNLISYTDKGYLLGANTGVTYIFNNNMDFDLGYRFLKTSKMKEIKDINDLSFSMHYFY